MEEELRLPGGEGRTTVHRRDDVVLRASGPWSSTVLSFLRHLEAAEFTGAPRVSGTGFDDRGREVLTFVEGTVVHPDPWPEDAFHELGVLLRDLHACSRSFTPPAGAIWRQWYGRELGAGGLVYGHCDLGPWNIIARNGLPVAFIDWETAGPVDPLVELGQLCWLNAQLHDDDVGARVTLGSPEVRAGHAALIADGYGLPKSERAALVQAMIDVAIADAADQAIEHKIDPDSTDLEPLWGLAWRTRAAAWMMRRRAMLAQSLGRD